MDNELQGHEATRMLWCLTHDSSVTGQTDRCLQALNMALRLGINPFDAYNNRRIKKCRVVNAKRTLDVTEDNDRE